jgi:hypothetical protein
VTSIVDQHVDATVAGNDLFDCGGGDRFALRCGDAPPAER